MPLPSPIYRPGATVRSPAPYASLSFTIGIVAVGSSTAGRVWRSPCVFLIWSIALLFLVLDPRRAVDLRRVALPGPTATAVRFARRQALAVQPRLPVLLAVFAIAFTGLQGALTFIGIRSWSSAVSHRMSALFRSGRSYGDPGLVAAGWIAGRWRGPEQCT